MAWHKYTSNDQEVFLIHFIDPGLSAHTRNVMAQQRSKEIDKIGSPFPLHSAMG